MHSQPEVGQGSPRCSSQELTQEGLAKRLGNDLITISRWERGESAIDPNAEVVVKLLSAEKLGIDPDMTIEEMSLNSEWKAEVTEIRIDGSDPSDYRPIKRAV